MTGRTQHKRGKGAMARQRGQVGVSPSSDPTITISEQDGVRYLHFGNEWVQGAMRVRKPYDLELDYSRHMMAWLLFRDAPARLLQVGLGPGSLTKFTHSHFDSTHTTVVENSNAVLRAARSQFKLPADDERLEVVIDDGQAFVCHPGRRGNYQVLQVDVFDAQVRGPVLCSDTFYQGCRRALDDTGVMTVNLFGDVASYDENVQRIRAAFNDRVLLLPPVEAGNVIVIAFVKPSAPDWAAMYTRAEQIECLYGLKATGWVNGLKASVAAQERAAT